VRAFSRKQTLISSPFKAYAPLFRINVEIGLSLGLNRLLLYLFQLVILFPVLPIVFERLVLFERNVWYVKSFNDNFSLFSGN
jgi:hypothetical protein